MARDKTFTKNQYEERIQQELNLFLRRSISDPRLTMVSITRVELSPDKSWAKVYWDTFDVSKRGDAKKAVDSLSSKLRSLLAKSLQVRHTPELNLIYDSQFEDERRIEKLLNTEDGE